MSKELDKRAIEIYLSGKCTLKQAYAQAEAELSAMPFSDLLFGRKR